MIDTARLETNLIHVARRYAPTLIPAGWQKPGDYSGALSDLARALATYNVLVLVGDVPATAVKAWTDGYSDFYALLAGALFPSYTRVSAFYLDQAAPPLVAVYGEATPVITALAGFVAPYVVARQGTRPSEVEVQGMMDMILEELEATDLPRGDYRRLRDSGAAYLRALLEGEGRQFPLTPAARPIFAEMAAAPANIPAKPAPPPPTDLPETTSARRRSPTRCRSRSRSHPRQPCRKLQQRRLPPHPPRRANSIPTPCRSFSIPRRVMPAIRRRWHRRCRDGNTKIDSEPPSRQGHQEKDF